LGGRGTLFNFVPYLGPVAIAIAIAAVSLLTSTLVAGLGARACVSSRCTFRGRIFHANHPRTDDDPASGGDRDFVLVWGWMWGWLGPFLRPDMLASVVNHAQSRDRRCRAAKREAPKSEDEKAPELRRK
jgi:hypothetical protein